MCDQVPPYLFITQRLELRACKHEDALDLFNNYTSSMSASEYLQRPPHILLNQTEQFIEKWGEYNWREKKDKFAWSIFIKGNNEAVGLFLASLGKLEAEIHFGIGPKYWNNGYVTEASLTILEWIKNKSSIERIYTICDIEHNKSINILTKIGMQKNNILECYLSLPNKSKSARLASLYEMHIDRSDGVHN